MTRKEQLKADLLKNFSDFQKIDPNVAPGGSDAANSIVAEGLADSIDRAIDDGIDLTFKGILRCSEINLLTDKKSGDLYTCSDAGVLNGSVQLPVTKTSVVLWTGDRFKLFLVVPEQVTPGSQISIDGFFSQTSRNPVENRLVTAALAATINAINLHVQNQENPHGVTAAQVGADPEGTAETLVSNHNSDESAHTDIRQLIEDEAATRASADEELDSRIDSEAFDRESGDLNLQSQIDSISSRSDVVDVVASYEELVAYDTSTLADNDVIKVLEDGTHEDAIAYYRWSTTTEAWSFIGLQGPYYTISQTDTLLAGKSSTGHTHSVKINGVTKTIPASGGTAIDLGNYDTSGTASSAVSTHNSSSSAHSSLFNAKAPNTPTFSQASSRANLNGSGETIATIFGKIKKWFADLGTNSLAWISKNTSGSDSKVLSEKGNWVSLPSVPTALSQLSDDSIHRLVTDSEKSTWNNKQNALDTQTAYSNKGSGTMVARITTNSLGQVTKIEEVSIQFPSSSGMSTDAINASDVAIRNLINKITRTSTNIGSDEYFVTVASDGQWKYKMSTLKSWCTEGLADDSEVMHKASSETITGEKTLSRGSGQNTYWRCQRTDTGNNIQFGIGSGGVNRGIYDEKTIGGWLLRLDDDGKVLLGDNSSKAGSVFLKLPTYASKYNISSGIWANQNPGTDVGDIQFGCFCYYGDTKRYGVQLDADRSSGQYGIWCYPSSAVSKWLCYMESDGVAHLGKNTDAQVQLGNRVFDFSGTFSASSNTIYFI